MDLSLISSDVARLQNLVEAFTDPQVALPDEFTNSDLCGIAPTLDVSEQIVFPIPNAENFLRDGYVISVSKRSTLVMDRTSISLGNSTTELVGSDEFTNSILIGSLTDIVLGNTEVHPLRADAVAICRYENVDPRVPRPQTIAIQRLIYPQYGLLSNIDQQKDFYQYRFQLQSNVGPRASLYNLGRTQPQVGVEVALGWDPVFLMTLIREVLGTLAELQEKSGFVHGELTIDNIGVDDRFHILNFARSQLSYEDVTFYRQTYFSEIYRRSIDRIVRRLDNFVYLAAGTSGNDYHRLTETGILDVYLPGFDTYVFLVSLLMLDGVYDTLVSDSILRSKIWDPIWQGSDSQSVLDRIQLELRKRSSNSIHTIVPILAGRKLLPNAASVLLSRL